MANRSQARGWVQGSMLAVGIVAAYAVPAHAVLAGRPHLPSVEQATCNLPPGHPPVACGDDALALPPGHPHVGAPRLPPGHPRIDSVPRLPPGHPPIGGAEITPALPWPIGTDAQAAKLYHL